MSRERHERPGPGQNTRAALLFATYLRGSGSSRMCAEWGPSDDGRMDVYSCNTDVHRKKEVISPIPGVILKCPGGAPPVS